jgi:hypothetical protein
MKFQWRAGFASKSKARNDWQWRGHDVVHDLFKPVPLTRNRKVFQSTEQRRSVEKGVMQERAD